MTNRPLRVALLGHSSRSDNLGVGALTVAQIEILRGIARTIGRAIEITVLEWRDPRTPYVAGDDIRIVEMDGKFLTSPRGYWREVGRADVLIDIGAGDSFTDIYSGKRLRWMFWMKYVAHVRRRPLVVAPQTIGPFSKPMSRVLARWSMKMSALVVTRDALSTKAAAEIGVTRGVIEASDVALRLPFDPAPAHAKTPVRVGLNVSGLLMSGGYTGKNQFGLSMDYPALIGSILAYFREQGCEVHLIAHVLPQSRDTTNVEDDYAAAKRLQDADPALILAPPFRTPSQAKSYIATMDFFLGARMHACIAAFSSGVPVVPMAYSRKFAGLFGSIGYDRTVDCTAEDAGAILAKIKATFEARDAVTRETKAALNTGLTKLALYERALQQVLAGL